MGHPIEIFTPQPPDSCICAICHDVLQDAVNMADCGHSFCQECAEACLLSETCPTCRAGVMDITPNFIVRDLIGSMKVKCPNGKDADDSNSKRMKGSEGQVFVLTGCKWSGECKDLKSHEKTCEFEKVSCFVEGCQHECCRKDMKNHLSGSGFLCHMNLMKRQYDEKMEAMQRQFDKTIAEMQHQFDETTTKMQQKILEMGIKVMNANDKCELHVRDLRHEIAISNSNIRTLESQLSTSKSEESKSEEKEELDKNDEYAVEGCYIKGINGVYKHSGMYGGVRKYSKTGMYNGEEVTFIIHRDPLVSYWYISQFKESSFPCSRIWHFYKAGSYEGQEKPSLSGWQACYNGIDPAPKVRWIGKHVWD